MDWAKVLAFVATFLSGGLAGSVFTWYVNLPVATVVAYSVSTTTIAADPAVRSAVPRLRLQIGNEEVAALYTHAVEFSIPSGPHVERIEVALVAMVSEKPLRTFGVSSFAPSPLHEMACGELGPSSVRCIMGPIGGTHRGPFRVIWATNHPTAPKIVTAAKGIELLALGEYAARAERWWQVGLRVASVGLAIFGGIAAALSALLAKLLGNIQRRARLAKAQADVRAIASAVTIYAAFMGAPPNSLRDLVLPARNARGQTSEAFLGSIPEPPHGWKAYTYTAGPGGTFTVQSSGDGTTVRAP